ncbi:PTS sugar transporter subunit IIB [Anaerococcus lactolyticus]|nr:PTS sugar transporter subunit IIB [Anaerococcus lactolyticus]
MKILAVCGFGVGSSMVLKMTIEKVCKELNLEANVDNLDLSSAKAESADFILTSNELADELRKSKNIPIYPIKKYMDKEEVKNAIEDYLSTL